VCHGDGPNEREGRRGERECECGAQQAQKTLDHTDFFFWSCTNHQKNIFFEWLVNDQKNIFLMVDGHLEKKIGVNWWCL
jgi:hypothetical protein